jgi:hypothetical protein
VLQKRPHRADVACIGGKMQWLSAIFRLYNEAFWPSLQER